jgi:hypothetical protein
VIEQSAAVCDSEKHALERTVEQKLEIADNGYFLAASLKKVVTLIIFQPTISITLTT